MILGTALPLGKSFFALLGAPAHDALFLARFVLACCLPKRRLCLTLIASCMRGQQRHRSNVVRFLRRLPSGIACDWLEAIFGNLLVEEPKDGTWLFLLDQTYVGHQSDRLENSFSTAHRGSGGPGGTRARRARTPGGRPPRPATPTDAGRTAPLAARPARAAPGATRAARPVGTGGARTRRGRP